MLLLISISYFCVMVVVFAELFVGFRRVQRLDQVDELQAVDAPLISVIVPACNEADAIGKTLSSLSSQSYRNIEIIVIDDRSTDNTSEHVQTAKRHDDRISLIQNKELPTGWLGKAYAMHIGAKRARGEFLLFMDADVQLRPSTITRALHRMKTGALDHLCLLFENKGGSALLNALIFDLGVGLIFLFKPWKANDPKSRFFIGVGAFNLVRRTAYDAIGGHTNISLQVIDDIFLGKLIKRQGFRQDCLLGTGLVSVPWYATVPEMIHGLMKNVYCMFHFRIWLACIGAAWIFLLEVAPFWAIFMADWPAAAIFGGAFLVRILLVGGYMASQGHPPLASLWFVVTPYISLFIIIRAVYLVHKNDGIRWREGHYPLEQLREQEWVLSGVFSRR